MNKTLSVNNFDEPFTTSNLKTYMFLSISHAAAPFDLLELQIRKKNLGASIC